MAFFESLMPLLEIITISVMIYYLLTFFWNTRAIDLILGALVFLATFLAAKWLHFAVLEKILVDVVNVAVIAILIIFQPELRMALMKLSVKGKRLRDITEFDKFIDSLTLSVYRLAEKNIGALVVLETQDSLEEYARRAVPLYAEFSSELLETLFDPSTPLHDGAVLLRGRTLLSASTILPLAEDISQLVRGMGTRHRAALGMSQITDALIIVVSEESGKVSIAREGILTRGIKPDRFRGIVRSIFNPPQTHPKKSGWFGWLH